MYQKVGSLLIVYGIFLLVGGLVGYGIAEESATAALFNGAFFGIVMSLMGILLKHERQWAFPASLSATGLFSLTFLWRVVVRLADYGIQSEVDRNIVLLLGLLGVVSSILFVVLLKHYRH
jgi:uncharacterized membrane protein (UPF0136 family)